MNCVEKHQNNKLDGFKTISQVTKTGTNAGKQTGKGKHHIISEALKIDIEGRQFVRCKKMKQSNLIVSYAKQAGTHCSK